MQPRLVQMVASCREALVDGDQGGRAPPHARVQALLQNRLTPDQLRQVPRNYFRIGHVLLLPASRLEPEARRQIAQAYAEVLGQRTVLEWQGEIRGQYRQPAVAWVWGDKQTETQVVENGVRFGLDAARIMFSPGNQGERRRMAETPVDDEVVIDLFAGLGYLSMPLAVHQSPRIVYGCEINPVACSYLEENVERNAVEHRYLPLLGDCRDVAPRGVADRVLMGYLHATHDYFDVALETLKPTGGRIHFHFKDALENWPDTVMARLLPIAGQHGMRLRLDDWHRVKSYAPMVDHGVLELQVTPA